MTSITPADMMRLQYDYYNTLAEDAVPLLLAYVNEASLSAGEKNTLIFFVAGTSRLHRNQRHKQSINAGGIAWKTRSGKMN